MVILLLVPIIFQVESIEWSFEDIGENSTCGQLNKMADFLANRTFDLVINLPMRDAGARRVSNIATHGYRTRRMAVDFAVPLITNVKCAKLLIEDSSLLFLFLSNIGLYVVIIHKLNH
jgi:carbamoyl-phosphate synthase/aspartate carbamoyltransferase/dihydroorotase